MIAYNHIAAAAKIDPPYSPGGTPVTTVTQGRAPNSILNNSAVFAQFVVLTSRQTDHGT